jgi:hypothetical protein
MYVFKLMVIAYRPALKLVSTESQEAKTIFHFRSFSVQAKRLSLYAWVAFQLIAAYVSKTRKTGNMQIPVDFLSDTP